MYVYENMTYTQAKSCFCSSKQMYMQTWVAFPVPSAEDTVPAYMEFAFRVYNAALLSANRVSLSSVYLPKICKNQAVVLNNRPHFLATLWLTVVIHPEDSLSSGTPNLEHSVGNKSIDFTKFWCQDILNSWLLSK